MNNLANHLQYVLDKYYPEILKSAYLEPKNHMPTLYFLNAMDDRYT